MAILSARGLAKAYGEKELFEGVTFGTDERDRVAVIGVNGSGKSTLLQILAGAATPDAGDVVSRQRLRIAYLPQNPEFDPDLTVLDCLFASDLPEAALVRDYEAACRALEQAAGDKQHAANLARLEDLTHCMDAASAWEYETRAKTILTRLGISDFEARARTLSGGYRKRLALAQALLAEPGLLALDEPTNHLDADTIAWLEDYLSQFRGALLLVTHDRYFLDRVASRIIEIDHGRVRQFEGNFSTYLTRKAELASADASRERRRRAILRKELVWLERGCLARTTKQQARIQRVEELRAVEPERERKAVLFNIQSRRLGRKIVEIDGLAKSLGGRALISGFSHTFARGERLGILGPNGCGKTTLARLIAGQIEPDAGTIDVGETVFFSYYDQEAEGLDPDERAIDYVKREGGAMLRSPSGDVQSAEIVLEQFHFTSQMLYTPVGNLSGGERRRLYLVRTLMRDPNFLILDEPTNDLDIQTLQALEDFLDGYDGCLLIISHDRYLLDRTVDRLLVFEPGGRLRTYPGGYSAYALMREENRAAATPSEKPKKPARETNRAARPRKLTFNEQRELTALEEEIPEIEDRLTELQSEMLAAATNYAHLATLAQEQKDLEARLAPAMERWEELATIAENG